MAKYSSDNATYVTLGDGTISGSNLYVSLGDGTISGSRLSTNAQFVDEAGAAYGVKHINNKPRVSAMPYLYDVAEGNVADHTSWSKIGFNSDIGTSEEDLWTVGGPYVWPAAEMQMQAVSTSAKDVGARAITAFADAGGSTTTVTCGTHGLANSDIVTISGTTNYNGTYTISGVATNTFVIAKAFVANDATGAVAGPGARTVILYYLDDTYAEKTETITLNGLNTVNTTATDIFRVQGYRVASAGATGYAVGTVTLKNTGASVTYSQIAAGYTRARNITYTVPYGKVLYITSFTMSVYGATKGIRFTTRGTYDATAGAIRDFFLPYTEVSMGNGAFERSLEMPTMFPATVRIKVSGVADAAGAVCCVSLRGWMETTSEAPAGVSMFIMGATNTAKIATLEAAPLVQPAPMGKPTLWERLRGRG